MTDVAREYGAALYQLAAEEQLEEQILEESAVLAGQFQENPDYVELLSTPVLPKAQRLQIVDRRFILFLLVYHTLKGQIQSRVQRSPDQRFSGFILGWVFQLEGYIGIRQRCHCGQTAFAGIPISLRFIHIPFLLS